MCSQSGTCTPLHTAHGQKVQKVQRSMKRTQKRKKRSQNTALCHRLLFDLEPCWGCSGTQRAGSKWRLSCACRLDRHTLEAATRSTLGEDISDNNVTILTETSHGVWDVSWHFGIGRLPLWMSSSSAHSISGSCEQGNSSFTFTGHRYDARASWMVSSEVAWPQWAWTHNVKDWRCPPLAEGLFAKTSLQGIPAAWPRQHSALTNQRNRGLLILSQSKSYEVLRCGQITSAGGIYQCLIGFFKAN